MLWRNFKTMVSIFSNIKFWLAVAFISLLGYSFYAFGKIKDLKHHNDRVTSNYQNALKIDSLETVIFKIEKTAELDEIVNQNKGLQDLVQKSQIDNKRINSLYYQQQRFLDSIEKKIDVSNLITGIRENVPVSKTWQDSTVCTVIKGNVTYKNDSLSVNVTSKRFNNEVAIIKHEGRRKPVKWLLGLRLGKREEKYTPQSKCGDLKVTVIEKRK